MVKIWNSSYKSTPIWTWLEISQIPKQDYPKFTKELMVKFPNANIIPTNPSVEDGQRVATFASIYNVGRDDLVNFTEKYYTVEILPDHSY